MPKRSSGEVRSQLYIALDLRYISQEQFSEAFATCRLKPLVRLSSFMEYPEKNRIFAKRIRDDLVDYKTNNDIERLTFNV